MCTGNILKRFALLGSKTNSVRVISVSHPVNPTVAKSAFAIKKNEQGMIHGSEIFVLGLGNLH